MRIELIKSKGEFETKNPYSYKVVAIEDNKVVEVLYNGSNDKKAYEIKAKALRALNK